MKTTLAKSPQQAIDELGLSQTQRQAAKNAVDLAIKLGAEQAFASYYHSTGTELSIRQQKVEQQEHYTEQGINITVYCKNHSGSTSTRSTDNKSLQQAVEKAISFTKFTQKDPYNGLPDTNLLATDISTDLNLYHSPSFNLEQAKQMALACEAEALKIDKRLIQCEGANISMQQSYQSMANSHDFYAEKARSSYDMSCSLLAEQDGVMQRDYEYTTNCDSKSLTPAKNLASLAAKKTLSRLGAKKISTRSCPIIFSPEIARTIWGSLLGAISGSAQYRKQSFLQNCIGKEILPDWVSITQNPHLPGAAGSRLYDSEGVTAGTCPLIENGKVANYLLSNYSANALGLKTTGNAGGINNLIISNNSSSLEDLLAEAKSGLYITEVMGQGVNTTTGDYSQGAFGYWFENGIIQYPVHEITIAGNLKELLKSMLACSNDIDQRSKIRCGSMWIGEMMVAGV